MYLLTANCSGWNQFSPFEPLYRFLQRPCIYRVEAYDPLDARVSDFVYAPVTLKKSPSVTLGAFDAGVRLSFVVPTHIYLENEDFGDAMTYALSVHTALSEDGRDLSTTNQQQTRCLRRF